MHGVREEDMQGGVGGGVKETMRKEGQQLSLES